MVLRGWQPPAAFKLSMGPEMSPRPSIRPSLDEKTRNFEAGGRQSLQSVQISKMELAGVPPCLVPFPDQARGRPSRRIFAV